MAQSTPDRSRPLSPHMQIYRWPITMASSITHRATGIANAVGTVFLAWWLTALASGPGAYATFQNVAGSWFGLVVLFGYTWALSYHLFNGVRHLVWDTGHGFDNRVAERTSLLMFLLSAVFAVALWLV